MLITKQFYNKNQFLIIDEDKKINYLQSYNSLIAEYNYNTNKITLYKNYKYDDPDAKYKNYNILDKTINYSKTTAKHLYLFCSDFLCKNIHDKKTLLDAIKEDLIIIK